MANNPQQALIILRDYPIKVLVTDQLMPMMTGIELVRQVRDHLNLRIPCVMLTGAPGNLNPVDLVKLQFFDFIDKMNTHAELVPTIRRAIQQYDAEEIYKYNVKIDSILAEQKKWVILRPSIKVRLIHVSSIIDPYIKDQEWQTEFVALKGMSLKQKISIHRRVSYSCEYSIETEIVNTIGLKVGDLVNNITAALEQKSAFTGKIQHTGELVIDVEQEIEVKELGDTPTSSGLVLQSREYQAAPVYIRTNCILEVECSCCQIPRSFNVSLDLPANRIALRQVEHFDKGPEQKIYTGFIQGAAV